MERLFKKRATSSVDTTNRPATLKKSTSINAFESAPTKRKVASRDEGRRGYGSTSRAPSLDVDIRNSLILPGLSQRFSVLLPSVSHVPETSLRTMLASQRARPDGPSITEEEEELLLAELRGPTSSSGYRDLDWDGGPPEMSHSSSFGSLASGEGGRVPITNGRYNSPSPLAGSASSPSVFASSEASSPSTSTWTSSPPATSTSFSSFQTFGVNGDANGNGVKPKPYGFSGGSGMRDGEYIRKVKKGANGRRMEGSDNGTPTKETVMLPNISPEKANAWYAERQIRSESPETSDHTPTPTSSLMASSTSNPRNARAKSPSASSTLDFLGQPPIRESLPPPTPDSAEDQAVNGRQQKKRQSALAGLSHAQMKRISMALEEIEGRLQQGLPNGRSGGEEEEMLANRSPHRTSSESKSQWPSPSVGMDELAKPTSPARLPPSPRSRNLLAQIEGVRTSLPLQPILLRTASAEPASAAPRPLLTPSRTQPIRNTYSSSSISSQSSAVPGYVPGQPRPIGSMHRSDGSVSSRSATPTHQSAPSPSSSTNRSRSDSNPSPMRSPVTIAPRNSSLAKSKSITQGGDIVREPGDPGPSRQIQTISPPGVPSLRRAGNVQLGEAFVDRRISSPLAILPLTPGATIEEDDETSDDDDRLLAVARDMEMPEIKPVWSRRSVADSRRESESDIQRAQSALGWALGGDTSGLSRSVSQEGTIDGSSESWNHHQAQSPSSIQRQDSLESLSSDFVGLPYDEVRFSRSYDSPITPNDDLGEDVEILRKLSGVGKEELGMLQEKLVDRAKLERQALRGAGGDSPSVAYSPALPPSAFPSKNTMPVRVTSPVAPVEASHPPSSWRFSGNDTNDGSASPQASRSTDINLPILGSVLTPLKQNNLSADVRAAGLTAPRRAAPPPPEQPADTPSEKNVEVIFTPPSEQLSRQSSAAQNGRLPLDEDPDVRRDFAARIAAATAALNRTPSLSKSARLERKPSRRGPMVISNPTLTSSSARIPSTPLTPPEQAMDPDMAKALEKTSGSTRKMSAKWRKFGFKKGPSISEDEVVALPSPAIPMTPKSATSLDKLDVPISLRPAESNPPTFNTFRFPPKSASTAMDEARQAERAPPGTRKKILGAANRSLPGGQDSSASRLTESTTRAKVGQKASDADPATIFPDAQHSPTPSDVSVVASFIEAGRALGLNNDQLNEMLAQKGMLDRSGTSFSSKSYKSTANTSTIFSHPSPSPASLDLCRMPSIGKDKRGLFRSLSKGKKTTRRPTPPGVVEPGSRDVLVRRTLLIPSEPAAGASVTPQLRPSPTGDPASGTLSPSDRHVVQRNPSIKRKPVRLSAEDQELVSGTPPLHKRNPSSSSAASGQSENETEPVALGFLHRKAQLGRSTSSARSDAPSDQGSTGGGSLYDLYNHDSNGGLEVLQSPSKEGERRASEQTNGSARAVEIREYADGHMVWSIVDALRADDVVFAETEEGHASSVNGHSRNTSYTSSRRDSTPAPGEADTVRNRWNGIAGGTQTLNLRHRDRSSVSPARPQTDVYYTSSADVADLIDHLSSDLDASRGRIDILPTPAKPHSSMFPYPSSVESVKANSPNPQYVGVSSPGLDPHAPVFAPRPRATVPAAGFSPKRQLFVRQGLSTSPGAVSFASSGSEVGRTVEDRLQALLDRLQDDGAEPMRAA